MPIKQVTKVGPVCFRIALLSVFQWVDREYYGPARRGEFREGPCV